MLRPSRVQIVLIDKAGRLTRGLKPLTVSPAYANMYLVSGRGRFLTDEEDRKLNPPPVKMPPLHKPAPFEGSKEAKAEHPKEVLTTPEPETPPPVFSNTMPLPPSAPPYEKVSKLEKPPKPKKAKDSE